MSLTSPARGKLTSLLSPTGRKKREGLAASTPKSPGLASPSQILERSHQLRLRVQGLLEKGSVTKPRPESTRKPSEVKPQSPGSSSDDDDIRDVSVALSRRLSFAASKPERLGGTDASNPTDETLPRRSSMPAAISGRSVADVAASFIEVCAV